MAKTAGSSGFQREAAGTVLALKSHKIRLLAESGIVGAAIGITVYGLRPVAEIQFMGFIYPALDQIFPCLRDSAHVQGEDSHVPFGRQGSIWRRDKAPELHSESTEALFCHMPGIRLLSLPFSL